MTFNYSTLTCAILTLLSTTAYSNEKVNENVKSEAQDDVLTLVPIIVKANKTPVLGETTYTNEDLQNTANSSKNITDFLRVNPNVQFARDQDAATTQGELKPADISINGALSHQNNFIINGVSNNNVNDPAGGSYSTMNDFSTGAQGMAINTDLLCDLKVLDSNVSAEYGQFTGGVISADTCAPKTEIGKIHGTVTYDYTNSDWSNYHYVNEEEFEDFSEPTEDNQKEFTKQGLSANLYGKLSEQWGMNVYASKRQSIIPVLTGLQEGETIDQERNNLNAGVTFFYEPSDTVKAKFGVDYGDLDSLTYIKNRLNSDTQTNSESLTVFGQLEHRLSNAVLTHKLSYKNIDSERDASESSGMIWHYAEGSKDWRDATTVMEGAGVSSLLQDQQSLSYSTKAVFDALKWGDVSHTWSMGVGYDHHEVSWERPEDLNIYTASAAYLKNLNGKACLANDPLCDEATTQQGWKGQYFAKGLVYGAGEFDGRQDAAHVFLQDEMQWKNLTARLGVRADYDSLSSNNNVAPRSSFSYKPFGNDTLNFTAGWNRYYDSQVLATELKDAVAELKYDVTRKDQTSEWIKTSSPDYSSTRRSDLDTPYADEQMLGISSRLGIWDLGLKWVHRDYKDEITRNRYVIDGSSITDYFEYGNDGFAEADIYTISLSNYQPLALYGTQHKFGLGVDFSDIFRSYTSYRDSYGAEGTTADENRLVSYAGTIMRWSDRPAENFNQPWTARASWNINFDAIPLKINHFFSYKSAYDDMISISGEKVDYEGQKLAVYEKEEVKPRFRWDMRTTYDLFKAKDYTTTLGLTINNVTDRHNKYTSNTITSSNVLKSEIGRQFIADISFKF